RSLVVGIESGYETVGCLFDFWHCVSSIGNVSEAEGPRRLLPSSGRQPRGLHALASVQEQCHYIRKWLRLRANIRRFRAPVYYPSPRLRPSSMHRIRDRDTAALPFSSETRVRLR